MQFQKDLQVTTDGKPDSELLALIEGYLDLNGVYRKGQAKAAGAAPPTETALIKKIQAGLSTLGYNPGPADGLYGARTGDAISRFQRDNTLNVDGKPTLHLLQEIERTATKKLLKTRAWPNRIEHPES